ncbi:MAG: thiamine pyrophosphate-binding protein [Butyrivibrio sp.]|nr:thiamine pyrophosphate-binding protein [Butyrivibrio sp.]
MIRVADYVMKRLTEEGVRHLFYVPGGQCVFLMDALRRAEDLTGIGVHHEQAAAMAAIAYSQYREHLGACLVTTGCAGTNTMTGVLHAWQDSLACIFISGQQAPEHTTHCSDLPLRQIGVQEADIVRLVEPITKYAHMLTNPKEVGIVMDRAIHQATTGRPGPVWIDIPLPVQNSMVDEATLERETYEEERQAPSEAELGMIAEALSKAERPVVFAGHGVRSAHAVHQLRTFVEQYQLPVVFTRFSVDLLEYTHPLNMGVVCSFSANRYANFLVQNADLVLCIGNRLSIDTTGPAQKEFARAARVIVIDIDQTEHQKDGVHIDNLVFADAGATLEGLIQARFQMPDTKPWIDRINHWKQIFPDIHNPEAQTADPIDIKYFFNRLSSHLPENVVALSDAGTTGAMTSANCHLGPRGRMIHAYAQGEMGFVLPGALGAAAAVPDAAIVAVSGDGSIMMNLQEFQTVVRNHFNIKLIINSNDGYSGVRHGQRAHFRGKTIGTGSADGLDFPDFGRVAEAFGIPYVCVSRPDQIDESLDKLFETEGPCILEVRTDPDQVDLHNGFVRYNKREMGYRPIEDQAPWLDRELFFKEMIIEPLPASSGTPV